jgi:ketol-acid reductoisomerase
MRQRVSDTAKWGDIACGPRVIDAHVKENMRQLLREIQSGAFARQWIAEHEAGRPNFTRLLQADDRHLIEQTGQTLRRMMPWLGRDQRPETRDRKPKAQALGRARVRKAAQRQAAKSRR